MAYRNNRNFDRNSYGGSISRNVDPWDTTNDWGMRGGGGGGGGNFMGNQNQNQEALALANNLINNILRGNQPPSLLDLAPNDMRGGGGGGFGGGYGRGVGGGGGGYDRFDDRMAGRMMGNRNAANNRNRRPGAGSGPRNNKPNKPGGIRKPNATDRSKKVLAKNSNNSKPTKTDGDTNKNNESGEVKDEHVDGDPQDSLYADVPSDMFYCHMCKKHMWDCLSFENHIKGRSHAMMKEGVEESYRLRATMIRQEAKIDEQLKSIEIERLKRIGKNVKASNVRREYCTMCDLHFYGHLSSHRKSEGHLTLKKFLHPKCNDCSMEFPTRIEYDAHLLAPSHMIKASKRTHRAEKRKNQLVIHGEADELKDVREKEEKHEEATEKTGEGEEGGENAEAKEGGEENAENAEGQTEAKVEVEKEAENVILDYIEGVTELPSEIDNRIPKYNCHRQLGKSLIGKVDCYECRICNRFFDTDGTAEIHTRTLSHHRQFIRFLNEKCNEVKIAEKRAAATLENERKKRARIEQVEQNGKTPQKPKIDPSELYDPCEATEDDDKPNDSQEGDITESDVKDESNVQADDTMESLKTEDADMTAPEEEPVKEEEPPAPEPVPEQKVETPVAKTPAAKPTATPAAATPVAQKPQQQRAQTAVRGRPAQRASPRGRGRGRYNRF
ncbi:zinc finger protein on ecdysone puffs [Lutzomyia longipalpis]|uniref:zinc finger protein on ecdysone puffs n=1 Tax=Lutzomyia longipalpis TaxID=7200 RepID=UPI002483849E|nr:zinc finger protein on ecdysone puffs [Lutzomyia longipalpis]